ncbi:probable leucine-rich repeat receptor-like protein kinase PEPR2 [Coccomyxa sp. Obi]|nr:probable leucine-rich repeat receptor-like protein kinase PEPR2 [Coccomyxa sp. Obi]
MLFTGGDAGLLEAFVAWVMPSVEGGYSADQQGLLYLRNSITNFAWYQQTVPCQGWDTDPVGADDICTWDGVGCNAALQVTSISFNNNAFLLEGNIADALYGASLIPNLKVLYLANQTFTGTLPDNHAAWKQLEVLDLSNNHISGSLPASWGSFFAFPKLTKLNLAFNMDLGGPLPATLELNNCNFTGSLPAQWAAQLPALQHINISSNLLTGTLPPQWSFLNLTVINLDRNNLAGSIPSAWGASGALSSLTALHLYSNALSGSLPATWNTPGTLPSLAILDVADNNLTGALPTAWGTSQSVLITQGNRFCGPMPPYKVFTCGEQPGSCVAATGASFCPDPLPVPGATAGSNASSSTDMTALLKMKAAFTNFDTVVRRGDALWDPGLPMCGWQGVTCWPDGAVQMVQLSIPARAPPAMSPAGTAPGADNSSVHASVPQRLAGNVADVLQAAQGLTHLTRLDFTNQYLEGLLPTNLSLPSLQELVLVSNNIQGTLPGSWSADGAFPSLRLLALDLNWQLTGPLTQTWGTAGSSMRRLEVLTLGRCNLTGTMPTDWVDSMPILSIVDINYNRIKGTIPQVLQKMQALGSLNLMGNGFNGTLPEQLPATAGFRAWPFLQNLHLDHNMLSGSLPASWGGGGSMASLRNLTLTYNLLNGSIPATWASDANGKRRFPALQSLILQPGNDYLCGPIPDGIPVAQYSGGPTISTMSSYCPGNATSASASTSAATSAAPSSAAASIGAGAIAGIAVAAAVAAILAALAIWVFVVRKRKHQSAQPLDLLPMHKRFSQDKKVASLMALDDPPQHDSDSMIPPQNHGPHSYVPFMKAPSSIATFTLTSSSGGQPGSQRGAESASQGTSRSSGEDLAPFSMAGLKDWELDLDALEVELDEEGKEVELGRGAFGVVVKGTYRLAPVAIKRLKDQSPEQQRAFLKEMSILRACRGSRYIIPFVGASLLPGNTILAMDYMDNGNLWDALPRIGRTGKHIFQWHQRGKRVAYEVALGLHFLHELRVVHLDLKSSNVLIAADGTAKIADVGLSAQLQNASHLSSMTVAGTWAWVAPEVILAGKVTNKADMFSFGVLLWEIITVERPAWRGNLREIRVPEEAPQEIADLVERCTGQPEDRPSAAEAADIIGPFAGAGTPLGAARSSSGSTRRGSSGNPPQAASPPAVIAAPTAAAPDT